MSNDIQKADQIAWKFYSKLVLVVNNARTTEETGGQTKVDKWFNLETPDSDLYKEHLKLYRYISAADSPRTLELQVLLAVPELTNNQALVYRAPDSSRLRVDPTPRYILLESWTLAFRPAAHSGYGDASEVAPPTIYKHGIPLYRSLFTLLRILPAWALFKRLRRRTSGANRNANFSIRLHVQSANERLEGILGFGTPPVANTPPLATGSHSFAPIPHPMGTLSLSGAYLLSPHFQIDELESLLSSRFLSLEEGNEFTPTLARNQQRESLSTSPGSLPVKTSLPASPPSSVAERFVLPAVHTRTTSLPGNARNVAQQFSRPPSNLGTAGSASGVSAASSSHRGSTSGGSKDDGHPMSAIGSRLRRESTGTGRGADLPSSPGPLPIRRPAMVHPFKSSTLSSSPSLHSPTPSLRQHSPLSGAGGPSLPSRPANSPTSSRAPPLPVASNVNRSPGSPVIPLRPSPTFNPSSLGDRRPLASAEGDPSAPPGRLPATKRYSSSFTHRYALSAGSEGSAKEGGAGEKASFLSTKTEDDDLSRFVQDIDAREPLSGRHFQYGGQLKLQGQGHDREETLKGKEVDPQERGDRPRLRTAATSEAQSAPPAAVQLERAVSEPTSERPSVGSSLLLTDQVAVDERLRRMNEAFMASLEGLGGRRRDSNQGSPHSQEGNTSSGSGDRRTSTGIDVSNIRRGHRSNPSTDELDDAYVRGLMPFRPRQGSGASRFSIASAEVIGKLELDDEAKRSRGP
ncbi:hypothetical protein GLOTRDRAFT_141074 [Gloeophyllum trabeum ATCC 11539]|uniref:Autophagy-related protein 13 n=1 Tax=Gloeophyllum trabeum (strain ATCC 11539 / FP-39264 / Madison 617) TaxID=670483 RepID=S7RAG6_GLOTA|nr:uncharacterized protein GLOTRDRAFT_141074 [Gloeophyllum trabeum ATCC 11539]EPQ51250.1 hypothetical protein GLOTRDRAFT_141074 [Gloeophyllum trabeum ATCC 11539]